MMAYTADPTTEPPPFEEHCGTNMNAPEHICDPGVGPLLHHRPWTDPFDDGETEHVWTGADHDQTEETP